MFYIVGQGAELVHFHQVARHHALCWRAPVGQVGLVAREASLHSSCGMIYRASERARHTRAGHVPVVRWVASWPDQGRVDDVLSPAVFDVADATHKWLLGEPSGPVIGGGHEFTHNVGCADLEEMNSPCRKGQCPYVRPSLGIAGRRKGTGDCLSEEEAVERLGIIHPVTAANNAPG